jgi:hypothetical protein
MKKIEKLIIPLLISYIFKKFKFIINNFIMKNLVMLKPCINISYRKKDKVIFLNKKFPFIKKVKLQ